MSAASRSSGPPVSAAARPSVRAERVVIGIGEFAITTRPDASIVTRGLGSCVAVCLWDPLTHVAGMLHFLLPESALNADRAGRQPGTFADTGIPLLFQAAYRAGAVKSRLIVHLCGGAAVIGGPNGLDVGRRNVRAARAILRRNDVPVQGGSLGGTATRTVSLLAATGCVEVTQGRELVAHFCTEGRCVHAASPLP